MCTAVTYRSRDFYFGRNLDYEFSYGESVVITPRAFRLPMRHGEAMDRHYAMIGMAHVLEDFPLYYDAVNEKGLCIAGLNFVGNAVYSKPREGRENVAQFELIPWLLGRCASVDEAEALLQNACLTDDRFRPELSASQLHWLMADKERCVVIESVSDGLHLYENPFGVLTNNPPFTVQSFALNNYRHLSPDTPANTFGDQLPLQAYSRGMGAMGLPGDLSSQSRFVRAAFVRANALSKPDEEASVSQFFHILGSVEQQRGCCRLENGQYEITLYSSCCNADRGIYYYHTYENLQPTAVDMHRAALDGTALICYPLQDKASIRWEN